MRRSLFTSLTCVCALAPAIAVGAEDSGTARPNGKNCDLLTPPPDAGAETGHGVLLHVFPRTKDVSRAYTGCQAVFITTAKHPSQLAWLVELRSGDPVRLWSADPKLRERLECRYERGKLIEGNRGTCAAGAPALLPSMPAGCAEKASKDDQCDYDSE